MFFTLSFLITLNFTILARKWPELMKKWQIVELSLPRKGNLYGIFIQRCRKYINWVTVLLMTSALIEHILSKPADINRTLICPGADFWEALSKKAFPEMFSLITYDIKYAIMAQIVTSLCAFYWNYIDLFLICISIGLSENIRYVNDIIIDSIDKYNSPRFWTEHWYYYKQVCRLVQEVNDHISPLIILSYSSNLFYICVQLLGIFE